VQEDVTERGFNVVTWRDRYDQHCTLHESSVATEPCIWLGKFGEPMHLTQEQVAALLPYLQRFVETGMIR
jgi:hypothetical protein